MEITPTTLILVGLTCVVLGYIASLLLNTLREDTDLPEEGVDQAPPGGRKGRYTVITRLWRERGAGKLVVEMDGRSFLTPESLDPVQRERLETSARELRAWLGMGLEGISAPPPLAQAPTVQPPVTASASGAPATPAPTPLPQAAQPYTASSPAIPYKPAPVVPGAKEEHAPANKSIVMQIEDILQDMIAGTPMANRGIHLTEDPIRGVMVQVGTQHFEGIEAVTDPEAKAVIRKAVEMWESTQ